MYFLNFYWSKKAIAVILCLFSAFFVYVFWSQNASNSQLVNASVSPVNDSNLYKVGDQYGVGVVNSGAKNEDRILNLDSVLHKGLDEKDNQYADKDLALAMNALEQLRSLEKNNKEVITEAKVFDTWRKIDRAKNKGYILPAESIFYKEWSVGLVDSANLHTQLDKEIQAFENSFQAGVGGENSADSEQYKTYKEQENSITQEIMAQYAEDEEQALEVLEKKLTALRSRIYGNND